MKNAATASVGTEPPQALPTGGTPWMTGTTASSRSLTLLTPTPTASPTASPTDRPTYTPTPTLTPTVTPSPTATAIPTATLLPPGTDALHLTGDAYWAALGVGAILVGLRLGLRQRRPGRSGRA